MAHGANLPILPAPRELVRWLVSDELRSRDGWVASWYNPEHPGYPYPEISAYLLRLLAGWEGETREAVHRRRLEIQGRVEQALNTRGALGRGGLDYVFDTAIGVAALCTVAEAGHAVDGQAARRGLSFVMDGLRARRAVARRGRWIRGERWSGQWQPHLLKCAFALRDSACLDLGMDESRAAARRDLRGALVPYQRDDGAFALIGTPEVVDTHVHCYALEGLLDEEGERAALSRGVEWLALYQRTDGGMPRRIQDGEPGASFCDVTAQAMRLFLLVDAARYRHHADAARAWLMRHYVGARGFLYSTASSDVNSWGTMFAAQALLLFRGKRTALV